MDSDLSGKQLRVGFAELPGSYHSTILERDFSFYVKTVVPAHDSIS